jgi:hypothetical protein
LFRSRGVGVRPSSGCQPGATAPKSQRTDGFCWFAFSGSGHALQSAGRGPLTDVGNPTGDCLDVPHVLEVEMMMIGGSLGSAGVAGTAPGKSASCPICRTTVATPGARASCAGCRSAATAPGRGASCLACPTAAAAIQGRAQCRNGGIDCSWGPMLQSLNEGRDVAGDGAALARGRP